MREEKADQDLGGAWYLVGWFEVGPLILFLFIHPRMAANNRRTASEDSEFSSRGLDSTAGGGQ
jgi:hypothetical protein